ncbi:MAG: LysR family transcriptional regulator [Myxococcales bacterium]|nr:LysR family transcriptional regulator [Myxococcales bacterium]
MSLQGLSTFLAVAEHHSFSAAAAALGISRSAVSQAVRALEAELGAALLVRTTRSVRLTDAGARLAAEAGPALHRAEDALAAVRGGDGTAGVLRLTVPHIAVPSMVAPLLPRLRARHPALGIEISVDDRLVDIIAERFDAGIRLGEAIEKHMVGVRISEAFRFVVVGAPAYFARHGTPTHPRDLVEHECIGWRGPTSGVLYRWEFERRGRELAIAVPSTIVTGDTALALRAAADGLGLAYVDEHTARPLVKDKQLVVVLEPYLPTVPGFFLYFPEASRTLPKLRALIELFKEPRR